MDIPYYASRAVREKECEARNSGRKIQATVVVRNVVRMPKTQALGQKNDIHWCVEPCSLLRDLEKRLG
jgi:hypothetical protein